MWDPLGWRESFWCFWGFCFNLLCKKYENKESVERGVWRQSKERISEKEIQRERIYGNKLQGAILDTHHVFHIHEMDSQAAISFTKLCSVLKKHILKKKKNKVEGMLFAASLQ